MAAPGARREGDAPELERDFKDYLNPNSLQVVRVPMEPSLKDALAEDRFQFERHGYFVADRLDARPGQRYLIEPLRLKILGRRRKSLRAFYVIHLNDKILLQTKGCEGNALH